MSCCRIKNLVKTNYHHDIGETQIYRKYSVLFDSFLMAVLFIYFCGTPVTVLFFNVYIEIYKVLIALIFLYIRK